MFLGLIACKLNFILYFKYIHISLHILAEPCAPHYFCFVWNDYRLIFVVLELYTKFNFSYVVICFNYCIYSFWFSGVFITKGDVGVGTIVGSAVFNILFVIGICGILAGQVIQELLVLLFDIWNIK